MKPKINSLFDMLAYVLRGINTVEMKLISDFGTHTNQITSTAVRYEVDSYLGTLNDNCLGIERIFGYLMTNDLVRTNQVAQELVHEMNLVLSNTGQSYLKDIFMVASLRSINAYKIVLYQTAQQIAIELELETPADILQRLIDKEKNAFERFDKLTFAQFTNIL